MARDEADHDLLLLRAWLCILITMYAWWSKETLSKIMSVFKDSDAGIAQRINKTLQQVHRACGIDAELKLAMQEVRVPLYQWLCELHSFMMLLFTCSMYNSLLCEAQLHILCSVTSIMCIVGKLVSRGVIPVTCRSVNFFVLAVYASFFCIVLSVTPSQLAFVIQVGSVRVVGRVITGVMLDDVWMAIGCNALLSVDFLVAHWRMAEAMSEKGYFFSVACMHELVAFCGLCLIFFAFNFLLLQCVQVKSQREESSHMWRWQASFRSLLAVLCDAVCTMSSDLQVIGPCQLLSGLQDGSTGSAGGLDLSTFLKNEDVPRLGKFLCTQEEALHDSHADDPLSVPAASLHVSLRSQATGKDVPVQLFAVPVQHPTRQDITYLIGLKLENTDALDKEEFPDASASLEQPHVPRALGPPTHSDRSSGCSTQWSVDSLATSGLGVDSVAFEIDAGSKDLAIHSVTINFDKQFFQATPGPRPAMSAYILEKTSWASLRRWLHAATEAIWAGRNPEPGPELHLRLPAGNDSTSLLATVLEAEDILAEELDDCGPVPVRIRLSSFQALSKRAPRFNRRRFAERQMPHIGENE